MESLHSTLSVKHIEKLLQRLLQIQEVFLMTLTNVKPSSIVLFCTTKNTAKTIFSRLSCIQGVGCDIYLLIKWNQSVELS